MNSIYSSYSDAELAEKINLRDTHAFEELYNRYWGMLFEHARRMIGNEEKAKDIVQDLFASLFSQMGQVILQPTIVNYLVKSIKNSVINLINHEKVKINHIAAFQEFYKRGEWITDNQVRERELKASIEKAIEDLPPKMRTIFELSRKAYMSHKQIAAEINGKEENVKKTLHRAIKLLRAKLTCFLLVQLMTAILFIGKGIN